MYEIKFIPLSESAVLLSFGNNIDAALHQQVMFAKNVIENNPFPGFIETVPAYHSLAVYFNPFEINNKNQSISIAVINQLKNILDNKADLKEELTSGSIINIPVCYDEEYGMDLRQLSQQMMCATETIIQLHVAQLYKVFMIGFTPGFPYMGLLPEKLFTNRKEQPRLKVAPGSVAIAGFQTGIYPLETPGGWNIIGRTPLHLIDKTKDHPFLLKAGDEVKFFAITKNQFMKWPNS